jgi:hypothetical protein
MSPMRRSCLAVLMLTALIGCDSTPAPAPAEPGKVAPNPSQTGEAKPAETKSAGATPVKALDVAGTKLSDDEIKEISKIEPEAERKIALEQKLCPSSGEHLGSMETPVKVTLKGQTVFLCCGGCKKEAEAKPDEMLAKLGK